MSSGITPNLGTLRVWFLTGSQTLYGEEILAQVATQSQQVVEALSASDLVPVTVEWKPVLTSREAIERVMLEANAADDVIGVIT